MWVVDAFFFCNALKQPGKVRGGACKAVVGRESREDSDSIPLNFVLFFPQKTRKLSGADAVK